MPIQPTDKATRCGVKVLTWGTETDGGSGMGHFLDTRFFGGNVGHAAIQLVFPADAEGDRLVEQYCAANKAHVGLPFVKRRYVTPSSSSTNTLDTENTAVYSEAVYEVYWSWWPSKDDEKNLSQSIDDDQLSERMGTHFEWKTQWEEFIKPEKRIHKGLLGQKKMTYGPNFILHSKNLEKDDKFAIEEYVRISLLERRHESLILLKNKLDKKNENSDIRLTKTEINMIDDFLPSWSSSISDKNKISESDVKKIIVELDRIESETEGEKTTIENLMKMEIYKTLSRFTEKVDTRTKTHEVSKVIEYLCENITEYEFSDEEESILESCNFNVKKNSPLSEEQFLTIKNCAGRVKKEMESPEFLAFCAMEFFMDRLKENVVNRGALPLTDDILIKLDSISYFMQPKNWKEILNMQSKDEKSSLSLEDLETILESANNHYQTLKLRIEKHESFVAKQETGELPVLLESYLSYGTPPDSSLSLPIATLSSTVSGTSNGLNVENMLKKMQELSSTEAESFDLNRKNCSKTSDAILEAGATEEYQKDFFRAKVFGFFGTPQETFNHAQLFQQALTRGKPNVFRAVIDFNPFQRMFGACVRKIMDKKNGRVKKIMAVTGVMLLSPFLALNFSIKRMLDPLGTFKMASKGFDFARSRTFKGPYKILQGLMIVSTGSIALLSSPLAFIQWASKTMASKTNAFLRKFLPKKNPSSNPDIKSDNFLEAETDRLVAHERSLKEHAFSEKIKRLEVSIHENHVAEILHRFERILDHDKNAIPVLSTISKNKLLAFIHKHPGHAVESEYHELSEKAQKRIIDIQKRLLIGESIEPMPQTEYVLHALHQHGSQTAQESDTGHRLHAFHGRTKVARPLEDQPAHTTPRRPIPPTRRPMPPTRSP